jgi:hypothetical protein
LYWLFVGGILILYRPSIAETMIYIAGLQALFFPIISDPIYHFLSVLLIFYLLFPLIIFFDDYRKLLFVALIPLLFFIALKLFGLSDNMFLRYYGFFVGGIIAGKSDVYTKLRQTKIKQYFVLTIPLLVVLLPLWLIGVSHVNSFMLEAFLYNFLGIPIVLIVFFWAICYVKVFGTKLYAFFTFVAFSTYAVFLINMPLYVRLGNTLIMRFDMTANAAALILVALIPFVVITGYLVQFITNEIVSSKLT